MAKPVTSVVFDLGGVLIDWNPDYLYRKLIPDDAERRFFLTEICSPKWNEQQDAGRSFAEGEAELIARFPDKKDLIEAWRLRYNETIKGAIDGSVALLSELNAAQVPLYALTNWSAETFPAARRRFEFLAWFQDDRAASLAIYLRPGRDPQAESQRLARRWPGLQFRPNHELRAQVQKAIAAHQIPGAVVVIGHDGHIPIQLYQIDTGELGRLFLPGQVPA